MVAPDVIKAMILPVIPLISLRVRATLSADPMHPASRTSRQDAIMTARTRQTADNTEALDAFISAKCEIDAMLERLQGLSADHFGTNPDEVHWGQVGTLAHYASLLRQITDLAFKEGEHAE